MQGIFATHKFSVTDSRFEIIDGTVLRLRSDAVSTMSRTPTITVTVSARDRNGATSGISVSKQFTSIVLDRDDYFYGTCRRGHAHRHGRTPI